MVYGCPKDGFKGWQGKERFEAVVSSFGEANNGFGTIAADITAYSKKSFEDGTRAFEQLLGAKSFEQVIEFQSQYAAPLLIFYAVLKFVIIPVAWVYARPDNSSSS